MKKFNQINLRQRYQIEALLKAGCTQQIKDKGLFRFFNFRIVVSFFPYIME